MKDEIGPTEWSDFRWSRCGGADWDDQTFAGFAEIDGGDPEEERDGSDDFEVQETLPADAADFAQVAVAGNAGDERAEDERSDDHFD